MTVVSDTSVLLNLSYLGEARLLPEICGTVFAPPEVQGEFLRLAAAEVPMKAGVLEIGPEHSTLWYELAGK